MNLLAAETTVALAPVRAAAHDNVKTIGELVRMYGMCDSTEENKKAKFPFMC